MSLDMNHHKKILRPANSAYIAIIFPLLIVEVIVFAGLLKVGQLNLFSLAVLVSLPLIIFIGISANQMVFDGSCLTARGPFGIQNCSIKGNLIFIHFRSRVDKGRRNAGSVGFFISVRDNYSKKNLLEKNIKLFNRGDIRDIVKDLIEAGGVVDIDQASKYFIKLDADPN